MCPCHCVRHRSHMTYAGSNTSLRANRPATNCLHHGRLRLECDGTRAETRFLLSAKLTSPFKSAGASAQSTTGSRGVRISGSNAGYTMFRGSEGYWLPTPFANFPFTSPPVRHRVSSRFNWTLQNTTILTSLKLCTEL
jgi:hypothetical protein